MNTYNNYNKFVCVTNEQYTLFNVFAKKVIRNNRDSALDCPIIKQRKILLLINVPAAYLLGTRHDPTRRSMNWHCYAWR